MGKYSLLFSLRFEHLFFAERWCKYLDITAADDCRQLMDNIGIIEKRDFRGIHLFFDDEKEDILRLYAVDSDEPLQFSFKACSRDPYFANYTDLPPQSDDSIFYFDNSDTAGRASGAIALNQDEFVSSRDLHKISALGPKPLLTRKEKRIRPFFLINIFAGENGSHLFDGSGQVSPKVYVVKFRNRQTHWKYFLLNELAKDDFYVEDAAHRIIFEKSSEVELDNQQPTYIYRSKTAIPLQEKSEFIFQLKARNSGSGKILIKRLPVASASQVGRDAMDANEVMVSEIFINR